MRTRMREGLIARSQTHLAAAGETWFAHMRFALGISGLLFAASIAALVHAFVPAWCTTSASSIISRLSGLMAERGSLDRIREESRGATGFASLLLLSGVATILLWGNGATFFIAGPLTLLAWGFPVAFLLSDPGLEDEGSTS